MDLRGSELGGVNATLWKEERGVRGTTGDATFEVLGVDEGVNGVRGAREEGNFDFGWREGVEDGVENMVGDVRDWEGTWFVCLFIPAFYWFPEDSTISRRASSAVASERRRPQHITRYTDKGLPQAQTSKRVRFQLVLAIYLAYAASWTSLRSRPAQYSQQMEGPL